MPAFAVIRAVCGHLPEQVLDNAALAALFPQWSVEKIAAKTGIDRRHIAAPDETAGDLAAHAAAKLFATGVCTPDNIDYVLLCTQAPDHLLPTTACLLQHRLGIPTTAGALDINLGCSGFVYALGLAKGLIETGQAQRLLLLTADTYSKFIHPGDKSVRTLFGDGAAAVLVEAEHGLEQPALGPFVYGTDGSGGPHLTVPAGGARLPRSAATARESVDEHGNVRSQDHLAMNGAEVFSFAMRRVPACIVELLRLAGLAMTDIDGFVLHQANLHMLQQLQRKVGIPAEKLALALDDAGNTVSSTIPLALVRLHEQGKLFDGARLMLVGFGVGYSWGACLLRWQGAR